MIQAIEEKAADILQPARQKLKETFGFSSFRQGQERAIQAALSGRDLLVIMPTGSGKSLCYQVPALVLPGVTVVVSPLIALMKDQVDSLALRGVPVTFINSSLGLDEQWKRLHEMEEGAYKLVYVAPERFRMKSFRSALSRIKVSLLAIDEAHCISQWGHDFRPDYRKLKDVRAQLGRVPAIALTATATPEVQRDIASELELKDPERVIMGFDRPNLALTVRKVRGGSQKQEGLREFLERMPRVDSEEGVPAGIIYTGTRKHAEEVAEFLNSAALTGLACKRKSPNLPLCRAYHAGMEAGDRKAVQEDFMEGRLPWVTATNAFGMGVDKSDIRFVIHYDLPGSIEEYYQEVGRAGRDGLPSWCLLLFSESDRHLQEFFIEGSNPSREVLEAVYRFLFGLGENPIFRTLVEMEETFRHSGMSSASNPMVFRSSVSILERGGALERLEHYQNLAEISPTAFPLAKNPYAERAKVKHVLHEALDRVFQQSEGDPASISLENWAAELEIPEDSVRRGLSLLAEEGIIRYLAPFRGRAIRLPVTMRPLSDVGVDFETLRRRRERDEERLNQVLRFAKSRACRRNAILWHFGEQVPAGRCGHCDNCELEGVAGRASRELDARETTIVRKALSGVARARGRCGRRRIIQMLRGSRSQGVSELGLDKISTYGILSEYTRDDLGDLFDQLESSGFIQQSGDRYPLVFLTDQGVRVMKGDESLKLAFPARLASSRTLIDRSEAGLGAPLKQREEAREGQEGGADFNRAIFERLRRLRREIASELGVPAYRVFNDRTLKEMARIVPRSEAELLAISGVGEVTLERFGKRFLRVLEEEANGAGRG